jgi:hypothetical protein
MPTYFTSNYFLTAMILNPVAILHLINTFCSRMSPTPHAPSMSKYPWVESLGPPGAMKPYFDVHSNEQLCWGYTFIMVLVQILAYGTVVDNRTRRKGAKDAARKERERKIAVEKASKAPELPPKDALHLDGACDHEAMNGDAIAYDGSVHGSSTHGSDESDSETTTTSEEETIV